MSDLKVGRIEQLTHTPGPWRALHPIGDGTYYRYPDGGLSTDIYPANSGEYKERIASAAHLPNARLIAAAPDLLAACQAFVEAYKTSLQLEKTDVALRLAEAAIAKAEG